MTPSKKIEVLDKKITVLEQGSEDYICLTDMVRGTEGDDHIRNWLRNRNTVEFLGIWETIHNPNFKPVEFDGFRKEAGLNNFNLSPKRWIEKTGAIGLVSVSGRYGGTYAHKDIAFEFGSWISPVFKLYLIKEYQRLKEIESNHYNLEWNVKRMVSKANYQIHTDAVKEHLVPVSLKWNKDMEYAEEADILNVALFGCTAKEWKKQNQDRANSGENIRDTASSNELIVLSNLESHNARMIRDGIDKKTRFVTLQKDAQKEMTVLGRLDPMKMIKKTSDDIFLIATKKKATEN